MTNEQIQEIYRNCSMNSHSAGLRAVWMAGYCDGAAVLPTATMVDRSQVASKPAAVIAPSRVKR